jgi:hypothetical protein
VRVLGGGVEPAEVSSNDGQDNICIYRALIHKSCPRMRIMHHQRQGRHVQLQ